MPVKQKLELDAEDFMTRIAHAHLRGDGQAVKAIWLAIAREELTDTSTLAWAKLVAEWIVGPQEGVARQQGGLKAADKPSQPLDRTGRIHAALAVTGWAEPALDTLDDGHLLLMCAMEGLRPAAALVWHLIATGKATQGMREQWLDHVASRVVNAEKTPPSNKAVRPNAFMGAIGMSGKTKMTRVRTHKRDSQRAVDVIHHPPARRRGGWRIFSGSRMSSGRGSSPFFHATREGCPG